MANINMEEQLKQTKQQLSKQIAEECQAVQLRSGKTLNTPPQGMSKPPKIHLRTVRAQGKVILELKRQKIGGRLALNAQIMLRTGVQRQKQGRTGVQRQKWARIWR